MIFDTTCNTIEDSITKSVLIKTPIKHRIKIKIINIQTSGLLFEELNNMPCRMRRKTDMIENAIKHRRRM